MKVLVVQGKERNSFCLGEVHGGPLNVRCHEPQSKMYSYLHHVELKSLLCLPGEYDANV